MTCSNCGSPSERDIFFCSFCGHSLSDIWYQRSSFCWGGNGGRLHNYRYQGMTASNIRELHLLEEASYPVHWNKWVFYTEKNTLKIYLNRPLGTLQLSDNPGISYHPMIVPPFLYFIPHGEQSAILRLNILNLVQRIEDQNLTRDLIETTQHNIIGSKIYPASWFQPEAPIKTGRIAIWCHDSIRLLDISKDTLTELYESEGLLNDLDFAPCFDANGNLWVMDNDLETLLKFSFSSEEPVETEKFDICGRCSAPVSGGEFVYYYQNKDGATINLVQHPARTIAQNINSPTNRLKPVQHISPVSEDHPHYQASKRVLGVDFKDADLSLYMNRTHPIWISINDFNALLVVYK